VVSATTASRPQPHPARTRLQELGLTLEEIRSLLLQHRDGGDRDAYILRVQEALAAQETLSSTRMQRLAAQRASIEEAHAKLAQCEDCDFTPSHENSYCEPCQITGECLPELLSGLF